jgi:hypothetical protein
MQSFELGRFTHDVGGDKPAEHRLRLNAASRIRLSKTAGEVAQIVRRDVYYVDSELAVGFQRPVVLSGDVRPEPAVRAALV